MRIRLDSIGCRLNIGEIEAMARTFAAAGHRIVGPGEPADLCILNTCTVTAIASRKSRHFIRQLKKKHPGAQIVATGCLAELEPETVSSLGVDVIVGNDAKDNLPAVLDEHGLLAGASILDETVESRHETRTRAFLKVQDGCDNACTFCVVTVARGNGRSIEPERVLAEIRDLLSLGYHEVVLSGVHLGSYGHDLDQPRGLVDLVRRILDSTELPRLRLSSMEPWDIDPTFFELFDDRRLQPHLHLPLQSGSNETLRRMARKTTVEEFAELVEAARRAIPDVSISTDVMVGFPGESDAEFEESVSAVRDLAFSRLHIFRYSPRPGTPAASMPGRVPGDIAQERSRRLHELGERLMTAFHTRFVGRRLEALWEDAEDLGHANRWSGLTGNYIRVLTETEPGTDLANEITPVDLEAAIPGAVLGSIPGVSSAGVEADSRREPGALPVIEPSE